MEVGRPDAHLEIMYLGLGRELRIKLVLQNDQKHHISGYGTRFQGTRTFTFRDTGQKLNLGSIGGSENSKFRILSIFVMLGIIIGVF